jgi:hypothetical protein
MNQDFAGLVENAHVHRPGVQVDPAVWLLAGNVLFLLFTWRAIYLLARDHQRDLIESFEIVNATKAR